jgi:hypothetical protein
MEETIKFNKIVTAPSPVRLVSPSDPNGRDYQRTPFKDKQDRERRKKRKKDIKNAKKSERETAMSAGPRQKRSAQKGDGELGESKASTQSRLIDILV